MHGLTNEILANSLPSASFPLSSYIFRNSLVGGPLRYGSKCGHLLLNGFRRIVGGACGRLQRAKCLWDKTGLTGFNGLNTGNLANIPGTSWGILWRSKCRLKHQYRDFWYLHSPPTLIRKKQVMPNDNISRVQQEEQPSNTNPFSLIYLHEESHDIMPDQFDQPSEVFWWLQHINAAYGGFHCWGYP